MGWSGSPGRPGQKGPTHAWEVPRQLVKDTLAQLVDPPSDVVTKNSCDLFEVGKQTLVVQLRIDANEELAQMNMCRRRALNTRVHIDLLAARRGDIMTDSFVSKV